MNSIIAYFDCQGFYAGGVFWPRELAWLDNTKTCHHRVEIGSIQGLFTEKEKNSAQFLSKYYHGLELGKDHGIIGSVKTNDIIRESYKNIYTKLPEIKDQVAVKSKEAESYLKDLGIPTINLLGYGASCKNIEDGTFPVCELHSEKCDHPKCSLAIVKYMKKFVDNKKNCIRSYSTM